MEIQKRAISGLAKALASVTLLAAMTGIAKAQQQSPAPIERRPPASAAQADAPADIPIKRIGGGSAGTLLATLPNGSNLIYQQIGTTSQTILRIGIRGYTLENREDTTPAKESLTTFGARLPVDNKDVLLAMQRLHEVVVTAYKNEKAETIPASVQKESNIIFKNLQPPISPQFHSATLPATGSPSI